MLQNKIRMIKTWSCRVEWQESLIASPDLFGILAGRAGIAGVSGAGVFTCTRGYVSIPDLGMNGIPPLTLVSLWTSLSSELLLSSFFSLAARVPMSTHRRNRRDENMGQAGLRTGNVRDLNHFLNLCI